MAEKSIPHRSNTRNTLTAAHLREILHYDPETGVFRWKISTSNRASVGKEAGWVNPAGTVSIRVDNVLYLRHRLAILYMTGSWPANFVDHRNGDRTNDTWKNLRNATHQENMRNQKLSIKSTTGLKGVSFVKQTGRYRATITNNYVSKCLGYFATAEEAYKAYCKAARKLHGAFARLK